MGLRYAKAIVGVDDEAVAYTYGTPAAGDSFAAFDITINQSGDNYLRRESKNSFVRLPEIPGLGEVEIGFKIPLVGAAAAGTAPYYDKVLKGCGLQATIVAVTSVTYKPWSTFDGASGAPTSSYSVSVWVDGVKYSLKGGMGNCTLEGKAGEPMVWSFTFKGAYQPKVTEAAPSITLTSLIPPSFLNALVTLQAYAPVFESLSIDLGNEFGRVVDANDTTSSGLRGYTIVNRRILGKCNPEDVLIATHDFNGKWRSGAQGALNVGVIGATAGNRIQVTAGAIQYHAPQVGEREGQTALDLEFAVVGTGADGTDLSIIFT